MENSFNITIEKIKLEEQIMETKLKEKREYDITVANLNRSIRDTINKAEKIKQDVVEIQLATENLQYQLDVRTYKKNALLHQVDKFHTELNQLRTESDRKIAAVWELRANLSEVMKLVAESCDVRTLLIKSTGMESKRSVYNRHQQCSDNVITNTQKLQNYVARREQAINKRKYLLDKPEKDDEFIRIKEALRYSELMVASLKDQKNN